MDAPSLDGRLMCLAAGAGLSGEARGLGHDRSLKVRWRSGWGRAGCGPRFKLEQTEDSLQGMEPATLCQASGCHSW